jgi:hypothetical protein
VLKVMRYQALDQGLKRFSTGEPCVRGHMAERATSHGRCIACVRESSEKRRTEHRDAVLAERARWRERNRERERDRARWYRATKKRAKRALTANLSF